ncbi:MAG TPA: glycosyltransferase family 9 protein [Verrucomicrobiae bacterium]|nr:glycosyltransferase family 9 protein [Verrucomicrobiae bacterium]
MNPCKNILLIRFKAIGDVVLTLPAVHAIRENFPDAHIVFFTITENAPLLQGFREVDEVIALDRAALRSGNPFRVLPEFFRLLRRLRAGQFSLVVDFQGFGETAWLARFTGAPHRWGSVYGSGRAWAYTKGVRRDNRLLIADWNLSLLKQCGLHVNNIRNEYILPAEVLDAARRIFAANRLNPERQTLFIQAFTSTPHKNWPFENYLSLAAYWRNRGVQVIFGGGPGDIAALEPARAMGCCVAAGNPLLVSAGLVKLSTVAIGGVTGLLHLAVAMQKRVVMLVGPANEPGFPYQHHDWGLTPTVGENVSGIEIGNVIKACERAFVEQKPR